MKWKYLILTKVIQPVTLPPPTPKIKIHPFYIEIKGKWNELAAKIKDQNEGKPLIKMDGELFKVHWKNYDDFRKTQSYLDSKFIFG